MDYKLELVLIPVSYVDRAKKFPHPERNDYSSFADFSDPDGNTRVLQEVGHRRA